MNEFTFTIKQAANEKTITFSRFAQDVEDLKKLDITDEYLSACAVVFALAKAETDKDACKQMLEYINGPEDVSAFDMSFINDQIKQYPYVMRSYFVGATSNNNYKVEDVSITIKENPYSRDEAGYVKLWLRSAGASSDRGLTLRQKASTKEWFLFSDTYKGLMAGIVAPLNSDKWA